MASEGSNSYEKTSVIRGHHIYKSIWTLFIGEELVVEAQDGNEHNKHIVAVMKDGRVVKNIPRCISWVSWFFLLRGGCILYCVTGKLGAKAWSQPRPDENALIHAMASASSTQRLFKAQRLLPMWLNLDLAYKQGRRLFEGGFYSRIYNKPFHRHHKANNV